MHLSIHNKVGKDAYKMDHRNLDAFVLLFEDYLQKCDKGKMEVLGHTHTHKRHMEQRPYCLCVLK